MTDKVATVVTAALLLDLILGDPRKLPHPVVLMGYFIQGGEKLIRRVMVSSWGLKLGGLFLTLTLVAGTYFLLAYLLQLVYQFSGYLGIALSVLIMYQTLSVKSLTCHAWQVLVALQNKNLNLAREKAGYMVGRDTANLDEPEVIRATVESVAESTVDGIVAPLFYGFIGGPSLAMAYKAVNTLDSMVGYRNEKYRDLGWAAAKLDDLASYIPARLAGLSYLILAPFTPGGLNKVWKAISRDAPCHSSPNSGIPEAAVAGALKVQLGGINYYHGEISYKQTMGSGEVTLKPHHIKLSLALTYGVTFLILFLGLLTLKLLLPTVANLGL